MTEVEYALKWIKEQGASDKTTVSDWRENEHGTEVRLYDEEYDNQLSVWVWRKEENESWEVIEI